MCKNVSQVVELLQSIIKLCQCDSDKLQTVCNILNGALASKVNCQQQESFNKDAASKRETGLTESPENSHDKDNGNDHPEVNNINMRISELERVLHASKEELEALRKENTALKNTLDEVNSSKKEMESKLNHDISYRDSQLNSFKLSNRKLEEEKQQLQNEKEALKTKNNSLCNTIDDYSRSNVDLSNQLKIANDKNNCLNKTNAEFAKTLKEKDNSISLLETNKSSLEKEIRDQKEQFGKERDELDNKISSLKSEYAKISHRISDIPSFDTISELAADIKKLPASVKSSQFLSVFNLENIVTLLNQCGDSRRLANVWDTIHKKVVDDGECSSEVIDFMLRLIDIYNKSNETKMFEVFYPNIGDSYSADRHSRIKGNNVVSIKEVIMPGLRNSAGKELNKPVVR